MTNLAGADGNTVKESTAITLIALMVLGLFVAWHVVPALAVRDNPPVACQIAGGSWSPWSGWTCG